MYRYFPKYVKYDMYVMYTLYMTVYRVSYHPDAKREMRKIAKGDKKRAELIADAIDELANEPRPNDCTHLSGNRYRIRKGGYRVLYLVKDDVLLVMVLVIDRRGEAYGRKNMKTINDWS